MMGPVGRAEIFNVTLTLANTEYSLTLPEGATRFKLQARGANAVKLAFREGKSGTEYWTVKVAPNEPYQEHNVQGLARTLYLQSADAGAIVEVLCWI
jgi:hypothetical protein